MLPGRSSILQSKDPLIDGYLCVLWGSIPNQSQKGPGDLPGKS